MVSKAVVRLGAGDTRSVRVVDSRGGRLSEETGLFVLDELERQVRRLGLSQEDHERLVGVALVWILENRLPEMKVTKTWLASVLRTFRLRMSRGRPPVRVVALEEVPEGEHPPAQQQSPRILWQQLLATLGEEERAVVFSRLQGFTWKESLLSAGVPLGSHSFWQKRIQRKLNAIVSEKRAEPAH